MERYLLLHLGLLAAVLLPATAWAQRDLVEDAVVWASSIRSNLLMVDDRWVGTASLHDRDPDTAFYPAPGKAFEVQVRLGALHTVCTPVAAVKVVSTTGVVVPKSIELGGTSVAVASLPVQQEGSTITVDLADLALCGKLLRLVFGAIPEGVGIAALSAYAPTSDVPPPPRFVVRPWKLGVILEFQAESFSGPLEIQRVQGDQTFTFLTPWDAPLTWDRPAPGPATWRGRRIGPDGTPSQWSDPVSLEITTPQPLPPAVRGVVEGFYGRPWDWKQRITTVRLLAALGLDSFVYAPKDDPYHREKWRQPYPADQMASFQALLEAARACGVSACYAISPGLDMDPASEIDFDLLTAKLAPFVDMGYRSFVLAMDDIDSATNGSTGALHAQLTNKLAGWLSNSGATLMFVPTVYFGTAQSRSKDRLAYLAALKQISESVPIMYTGEGVFDAVMDPEHVKGIADIIGRKPLIWDNFPVNDFYFSSSRLFMGPVTGRDQLLLNEVAGVLSNPMTQQTASRAPLLSYGSLLTDPAGYKAVHDPADLAAVFQYRAPQKSLELFLADHSMSPKMNPDQPEIAQLSKPLSAFLSAVKNNAPDTVDKGAGLVQLLAQRYVGDAQLLATNIIPSFADEIWAPAHKRKAELEVGLMSISLLVSQGKVSAAAEAFQQTRLANSPYPLGWAWFAFTEALGPLFSAASDAAQSAPDGTIAREAFVPSLPDEVVQNQLVTVQLPGAQDYSYTIFSESGAVVDGNQLKWTAPTPGHHRHVLQIAGPGILWALPWNPYVHEAPPAPLPVVVESDDVSAPADTTSPAPSCSSGCAVTHPPTDPPVALTTAIALAIAAFLGLARIFNPHPADSHE